MSYGRGGAGNIQESTKDQKEGVKTSLTSAKVDDIHHSVEVPVKEGGVQVGGRGGAGNIHDPKHEHHHKDHHFFGHHKDHSRDGGSKKDTVGAGKELPAPKDGAAMASAVKASPKLKPSGSPRLLPSMSPRIGASDHKAPSPLAFSGRGGAGNIVESAWSLEHKGDQEKTRKKEEGIKDEVAKHVENNLAKLDKVAVSSSQQNKHQGDLVE